MMMLACHPYHHDLINCLFIHFCVEVIMIGCEFFPNQKYLFTTYLMERERERLIVDVKTVLGNRSPIQVIGIFV